MQFALFGHPVQQSLSPHIHRQFAQQAGLNIDYQAIDTAPGELAGALARFSDRGGSAGNVTLPLKGEARQLAASCSERVRLSEAANTLTLEDGEWLAESTDGPGLMLDLVRLQRPVAQQRVALLGAGGAAASVLATLLEAKPKSVDIFNRTGVRAETLAQRHAHLGPVIGHELAALDAADPFDLVINATSQGHAGKLPPMRSALLARGGFVYDMNYGAAAKALGQWCQSRDIACASGLGMLVGQAAGSFALWTGFQPALEPVLKSLADT